MGGFTELLPFIKLGVISKYPFLKPLVMSRPFIEEPNLPVPITVDRRARIYYNSGLLSEDNFDIAVHLLARGLVQFILKHHIRGQDIPNEIPIAYWRLASALAADSFLIKCNATLQQVPTVLVPYMFGITDSDQSAEDYMHELWENNPPPPSSGGGGGSGDSDTSNNSNANSSQGSNSQDSDTSNNSSANSSQGSNSQDSDTDSINSSISAKLPISGSSADGQLRNWELPDEDDSVSKLFLEKLAEDGIKSLQKQIGRSSGDLDRSLDFYRVAPRSILAQLVQALAACTRIKYGFQYRNYNREAYYSPPGIFLPKYYDPKSTEVHLVIDSSGSMTDEQFRLALQEIYSLSRQLSGEKLIVYSGDTILKTAQEVCGRRKINIIGGGGTDMGKIIQQLASTRRGQQKIVIIITDGETWWCDKPRFPVIIALTQRNPSITPPDWAKIVYLTHK